MSTLTEQFLSEIETYLAVNGMDATAFGRLSLNDPNFVFDLRKNQRSPSARTIDRVREFMRTQRPKISQDAAE